MPKRMIFAVVMALAIAALANFILLRANAPLEDLARIAQIIEGGATLVLVVSALVVAEDIRESVRARHLDGMRYVRSLIGTEEASGNRSWVYEELKKASWPLSPEDEKRALSICREFDHIGFLCRRGLVPTDLIIETYNRNISEMWDRLERFIGQWREQTHDEDYFWEFEWLARQARKVRQEELRGFSRAHCK